MARTNTNPAAGDRGARQDIRSFERNDPATNSRRTTTKQLPIAPIGAGRPDPLDVFTLRAWARARLWQVGEIDLHEAVDELQAAAEASGLVAKLGQDRVQAVMARAFAAVRDDLPTEQDMMADPIEAEPGWREAAAEYHKDRASTLIVEIGPERLERARGLLADDVSLVRTWAAVNKPTHVAASTLQAAEFLLQQKDPARMRSWLDQCSTQDREAILRHLEQRRKAAR